MTMMTLPNGTKGEPNGKVHKLLARMAEQGGFIARADGSGRDLPSVVQLQALAKNHLARLQHEYEGPRQIVTGAFLTKGGRDHLDLLNAEVAKAANLARIIKEISG